MPDETLYISEPDGVMQSITVDAHITRIRGVDGKIKWHVPQSGPQTITLVAGPQCMIPIGATGERAAANKKQKTRLP